MSATKLGAVTPDAAGIADSAAGDGSAARATLDGSFKEVPTGIQPAIAGSGNANPSAAHISRMNLSATELRTPMQFSVSLKMRNLAELQARVAQGEIISPAEMAQKYWPLAADFDAAAQWLRQQGFTLSPNSGAALILASGTVAQVQNAFQVTFARVANADGEFSSAINAPSVPAALAPSLVGINGLQPHLRKHPKLVHPQAQPDSTTTPFVKPFIPRDIATAYGANTLTQTGAGQTIAIIMSGYPQTSDLTNFWTACNVSQTLGNVSFINVNNGPTASKSSIDVEEASLDVEWSSSMAPAAKVRLYGTPSLSDSDLDAAYQQVYNDVVAHPEFGLHVVSLSYGGAENADTVSQLNTDDQLFLQLASAGVTVFAATGDNGSSPNGLTVETPACDPNVTGVGGTSITMNSSGVVTSETAWSGSGGGVSGFFTKPVWQAGAGVPGVVVIQSNGAFGGLGNRMLPDVSAPADLNTGCFLRFNGANTTAGGTSWSTPTWAGLAALINQGRIAKNEAPLGLLGPKIYPLQTNGDFRDIVGGNNGNYTATASYDMATGIGVPVFPALFQQLTTVLAPPNNVTVNAGQNAVFSPLAANGVSTIQWQRMAANTATWSNLTDNATYNGSATLILTVNATTTAMSGDQFRCLLDGVATPPATLVVVAPQFTVTTFAGQAGISGAVNGQGTNALFYLPNDVALDSGGNIFVADTGSSDVRKITPAGSVTLYAGLPGNTGTTNGSIAAAQFNFNNALDLDSAGNVYVADSNNNEIREIFTNGTVTTFAGSPAGTVGSNNGTGTQARFNFPSGIAVDSGGNIYVADTYNNLIRKITPGGVVTTLAGQTTAGFANGNGTAAMFNAPQAVAVDAAKNVYVADTNNNVIRKITPAGNVTTLAGTAPFAGVADGMGANARFNYPGGIAVDSGGNLYVTDTNNHSIRLVTPAGVVTTLAGNAGNPGTADGVGGNAEFNQPYGVAVVNSSLFYIADTFNNTIRKAVLGAAPTIQTQPVNQIVLPGANAVFSLTATGSPTPTFQWQRFPAGGSAWANLTDDATYNGSATAALTINNVAGTMTGDQFQCVLNNGVGNVTSNIATLTVESAPAFTTQPADQLIQVGNSASFTVAATGFPATISYQWQMFAFGGSAWVNLSDDSTFSGTATATLTITAASSALNGNQFRCVASNGVNPDATSNAAALTVQYPPSFNSQPAANLTVTAGQQAVFSVSVSGVPAPALQWQRLANGSSTWVNLTNSPGYNGVTSATLTINSSAGMNGDQFRLLIGNLLGNLTSNTSTLTVQTPPVFTLQPADQQTPVGGPASFTVAATAFPNTISYQWQMFPAGGSAWGNLSDDSNFTGTATASLTINATTLAMDGSQFRCVASNGVSPDNVSDPATLSIETAPAITSQPADLTVLINSMASFTLGVSGLPAPDCQWQRLPSGGSVWSNLTDDSTYNGTATATLTINSVTAVMTGDEFRCFASNFLSNVTSSPAMLTVQSSPEFTLQPANQAAAPGGTASFVAAADGLPAPGYQWQMLPQGGSVWSNLTDNATYNGTATAQLTINSATPALNGDQFRCVASNGISPDAISTAAILTIQGPPAFATQPLSQTVLAGNTAVFAVSVAGFPAPALQWQRLPSGSGTWANLSDDATYHGSTTTTLTVNATTTAMSGDQFRCLASNGVSPDATSNVATLTVQIQPSFTTPPTAQTVIAGNTAVFSAVATGFPAPAFQWQRLPSGSGTWANLTNTATYSGVTTATLTVNATTSAMNGDQFRLLLSNAAGNLTSSAVALTVQSPPSFTTQPTTQIVAAGNAAVFAAGATGFPAPTFQWQRLPSGSGTWANLSNDATYNGVTTATLTVNATTQAMSGDLFRLVITNILNSATSNAATLTIQSPATFTIQPISQTVVSGNTAVFASTVSGAPTPTMRWQLLLVGSGTWANLSNNTTYSGVTTATLTVNATTQAMNGNQFRLVISNVVNTATSNAVTLTVQSPPSFTTQPTGQTVGIGNTAVFAATVAGFPAPTLQWQRLPAGSATWANLTDNATYHGTATATLTITAATAAMNGDKFQLVITNTLNTATSTAVTLSVLSPPSITLQPVTQIVPKNQGASFTVQASGSATLHYQWQQKTFGGKSWVNSSFPGNTTATLSLSSRNTGTNFGTQFRCAVSNTLGTVYSSPATLQLAVAPTITTNPAGTTVPLGHPALFNAAAAGSPAPVFQWQRLPSGGSTWANVTDNLTFNGSATANLTLNATTLAMSGDQYRCVASNIAGNATSNSATLTLTVAPAFSTQPGNQVVTAGGNAVFTVAASGLPNTISYQWQMLAAGGSAWANVTNGGAFTGANTTTLTVSGYTLGQSGAQFRCVATNGISPDSQSTAATLTVVPPGYLTWAAGLNLSGAGLQPAALSFTDAIPNLARFAMNLGAAPTPDQLPTVVTQTVNGTPYLTLQYNQLKGLSGVVLVAQYSYDLVTWQPVSIGAVVQLADPNAQTSQYQASIAIPGNGLVFLRLVVQPAP